MLMGQHPGGRPRPRRILQREEGLRALTLLSDPACLEFVPTVQGRGREGLGELSDRLILAVF